MSTVYLAGPITGLDYAGATDWRDYAATQLALANIDGISPMRGKHFLKDIKELRGDKGYDEFSVMSSARGITSRDRYDCTNSNVILMNLLGAKRVSIGTMIEMGWADAARNPIILVIEKEGNPHEHMMVSELWTYRTDNLDEAIALTKVLLARPQPSMAIPLRGAIVAPLNQVAKDAVEHPMRVHGI